MRAGQKGICVHLSLTQLRIERIIIHEVPKHLRRDTESSPTYSEIESPLDNELRMFFREKIIETAGSPSAFEVVFDSGSTSPVPDLVRSFLAQPPSGFVQMSKSIAQHLHDTQGGASPGGLVTVAECHVDGRKALGILKLEKEEGVRLSQAMHEGLRTFDVSYIRDLILTRKTKLFKIGFFRLTEDGGDPPGRVSDEQRGYRPETEVANFFLTTFLGCRLAEDPRVSTKNFFVVSQRFFNEHIADPAARTQALTHLLSEVTSHRSRINVRDFARTCFSAAERQPYLDYLEQSNVGMQEIRKNVELIEGQTKKMALEFENNIAIVGPRDAFAESVTVDSTRGGQARVQITGKLKRARAK